MRTHVVILALILLILAGITASLMLWLLLSESASPGDIPDPIAIVAPVPERHQASSREIAPADAELPVHPDTSALPAPKIHPVLGPIATVRCCGIPLPDVSGFIRSDPASPIGPWQVQRAQVSAGCALLEVTPHTDGHSLLQVEGHPAVELRVLTDGSCTVEGRVDAKSVEGTLLLDEVPGVISGVLTGCGTQGRFSPDGRFHLEVIEADGCSLQPMVFLRSGGSVTGEDLVLEGSGSPSWRLVPSRISAPRHNEWTVTASLQRTPEGLLVELGFAASNLPEASGAIPGLYADRLTDRSVITSIGGRTVAAMGGAELVASADRLLQAIGEGTPIPFEVRK